MADTMDGQWIGRVEGGAPGFGVLELDDFGANISGIAYHFPDDRKLPGVAAYIEATHREQRHQIKGAKLVAMNPDTGFWLSPTGMAEQFPETIVDTNADLDFEFQPGGDIKFSYSTSITSGEGILSRSKSELPSELIPSNSISSWGEFKAIAFSVEPNRYFYRGQPINKRLRTSFHRTKRKNLAKYRDGDVNELRRSLSSTLKHVFDQRDPIQTGALYNLLQHHGYPTPLLDWSLSPFVAAYFAFAPGVQNRPESDTIRLFAFDAKAWREDFEQHALTAYARPHFSIIELLAIENPRMVPQQATATITNVDDIEGFIITQSKAKSKAYLSAIDLPISERQQVLYELDLMGINAGSLLPGLDGICAALRYKNFGA